MTETTKILTIQDISCYGQCSITVALPIISAFGIEDEEHDYSQNGAFVQVTGNVYIRAVMSAASVLYVTSRIVSDYDKVAGTDYADNILFSLK